MRVLLDNQQRRPVLSLGCATEHLFVDRGCNSMRLGGRQSYADPVKAGYGQQLMRYFFQNTDKISVRVGLEYQKTNTGASTFQHDTFAIQVVGFTLKGMFGPCDCVEYGKEFPAWKCNPIKSGKVSFAHFVEALEGW